MDEENYSQWEPMISEDGTMRCSCGRPLVFIQEGVYKCSAGYPVYRFDEGDVQINKFGDLVFNYKPHPNEGSNGNNVNKTNA